MRVECLIRDAGRGIGLPRSASRVGFMAKLQHSLEVVSTDHGQNRFTLSLHLKITPEGTLFPLSTKFRKRADRIVHITIEYPTYQEELTMKREATKYDKVEHCHFIDTDQLQEARIRRCLRKWDLHEVLPELQVDQLHVEKKILSDDSLDMWQRLPPLLRKAISNLIYVYIGDP